jgi:hypothetical protein
MATNEGNVRAIPLALFLLPFLIYWPIVAFPYLLIDDNWLLRGWTEPNYPSQGFISVLQGRPALMAMAWGSSFLVKGFGETGIQIMRLSGIAMLGVCAVLTYAYTRHLPLTKPFRFLAAALWLTLPATQVIVANGTWLTAGIAAALGAVLILLGSLTWPRVAAAVLLLWFAAATYQPCFFIAPALYILTLYTAKDWRPVALRLGIMIGAFAVYYFAWKISFAVVYPGSPEDRYNPRAVLHRRQWLARFYDHMSDRLWILAQIWDVPASFPRIKGYVQPVLLVTFVAAIFVFLQQTHKRLPKALVRLWPLALIPLAMIASEIPGLLSRTILKSYTTAIGSTIILTMAICLLLSYVFERVELFGRAATSACIAILALGSVLASMSVTTHFALPAFTDMRGVAAYAAEREQHRHADGTILLCFVGHEHIYGPGSPIPAFGHGEFGWSNVTHPFYLYWHSRSVIDMAGLDSAKLVILLHYPRKTRTDLIAPEGASTGKGCGPDDFLDVTKNDLYRPTR